MARLTRQIGPPGNNFRHGGLAGIAQRRAHGFLNPPEQSIREEILSGLLADKGGAAQISLNRQKLKSSKPSQRETTITPPVMS